MSNNSLSPHTASGTAATANWNVFPPINRLFHKLRSWFPATSELLLAYPSKVTKIRMNDEVACPVKALRIDDRIRIHSGGIVPCDGILTTDNAIIDYGFLASGQLVERKRGELIYAGGRIVGTAVVLKVHEVMTRNRFARILKQRQRRPEASAIEPTHTMRYEGIPLSEKDLQLVLFAACRSHDPYALAIRKLLEPQVQPGRFTGKVTVSPGNGVAIGQLLQLGNATFAGTVDDPNGAAIWVRIDSELKGKFRV